MSFKKTAVLTGAVTLGLALWPSPSRAFDTGVSDDRVSLPEGPGSLEGVGENVSVNSNMGLMSYAIDVEVPRGFEGVTPQLALRYSSGGGSSTLGMGWRMAVPSIERMTMRGVPRYDETDRFVSDGGNELVRVSETVGAGQPAIYRNRFESDFTRYSWHDRDGGAGGYWEVEYADGRVGFFGADAQGRVVADAIEAGAAGTFEYHLVEMVDPYGHRMRFDYVKDGATSLVSEIGYVFTSETPTYRVRFAYEGRADRVSDAKPGFEIALTQRLAGITVLTRGQQRRRYALTYEAEATSGRRSRLAQVETFGSTDELYPIVNRFGYSRGLGAQCDAVDCGRPFLTTMVGSEGLGVSLQSGNANLVDINGDALPDLIDASTTQARHRFFLNQLASDGTHTFSGANTSAIGETSAFALSNTRVQFIDVNGDGFTDLLSGGTSDQRVLLNRGEGDWVAQRDLAGSAVWTGADAELRFMDYDNDMDVDLIRSSATETFVFENDGNFDFVRRDLAPLGVAFSESIQFTDMNGDGLLDVVQMQPNQIQYKLNFGRGRFSATFATIPHPFGAGEFQQVLVEDIDSDGYADLVLATGNTVRYVLNRNGVSFEPVQTLSEAGGVGLPNREATTTVLAADMNGNGSVDVVWVQANGSVQYLDLFPVRSHLLTRIENAIGRVTTIAYEPSVQQMARAAEAGRPWAHPLPYPMTVVSQTDEFDLLTNVHDVIDFTYQDGFYDGRERQFRGYAEVMQDMPGDDTQLEGRTLSRFDVGIEQARLHGKLLFERRESDGVTIDETTHVFGEPADCPVAEVPGNDRLVALGRRPITFACQIATETLVQEGADASAWVSKRSRMQYGDGYGNVTRMSDEGVVAIGGGACGACDRAAGAFGAPCGNQCLGDERFSETTYVSVTATGGRWMLNKVARERTFGIADGSGDFNESIHHYDGDAFVGLAEGQLTRGSLTRMTSRVGDGETIDSSRRRFDEHGNVVEQLDPNGEIGGLSHRRVFTYDADGLRVVQTDVLNEGPDGAPYRLRRTYQYDALYDLVVLASQWMLVEGDTPVTAADPIAYTYDAFGRLASRLLPGGDTGASPTIELEYDLGNPSTRLILRRRSQVGGPLDLETITCVDGRGRTYQTKRKVADGEYLVDGFTVFNLRSSPLQIFQSYTSPSAACDAAPPAGVRSTTLRYDGVGRIVETTYPDDETPGGASVERVAYAPLKTIEFDSEDTDPSSPHHDTPQVRTVDGLDRVVALERRLTDEAAITRLEYDALGRVIGYVDAMGHRKTQTYDGLGRVLRIEDPNSGTTTLSYDAVGNVLERVDGRGVAVAFRYDGLNREIERFDPADRAGTLIETAWDRSADCAPSRCPNTAGQAVMQSYPGGVDFLGYDVRRRRFQNVRVIEGRTYELRSEFDNADRTVVRHFPDGRSLTYAFDGASRVTGIPGVLDAVTYDDRGQAERYVHANGVTHRKGYDARMRLTAVETAGPETLQAILLERDRANNVSLVQDTAPGALVASTTFGYDAWYRSTSIQHDARVESMTFDLIDNVRSKDGVTYTYDGRPGAPSTIGDDALAFDEAGDVVLANGFAHTWDFQGRLVSSVSDEASVRSVYGVDHQRVARHEDGSVTHYVARDFEVRDGIATVYARTGRTRLARLESADYVAAWIEGADAEAVEPTAGLAYLKRLEGEEAWLAASARRMLVQARPDVVHLHADHLGSIVLATGEGGEVLGRQAFGAFGSDAGQSGFVDRYGFTGQEHEPHTGLVRFDHRHLSTKTGQWMCPDPAFRRVSADTMDRMPEAIARYSYVLNNPGTFVDPDGLSRVGKFFGGIKKAVKKLFRRNRNRNNQVRNDPRRHGRRFTGGAVRRRSSAGRSLMRSIVSSLNGDNDSEVDGSGLPELNDNQTDPELQSARPPSETNTQIFRRQYGYSMPTVSTLDRGSVGNVSNRSFGSASGGGTVVPVDTFSQSTRSLNSNMSNRSINPTWRWGMRFPSWNPRWGRRF